MKTRTLSLALIVSLAALLAVPETAPPKQEMDAASCQPFFGTWSVTRAQNSLYLSIESNGEVFVLWVFPGSQHCERTSWKPLNGGILIESLPRMRLWPGRINNTDEIRVELESIPELDIHPDTLISDHYFMGRLRYSKPRLGDRPVPKEWLEGTLDSEWDSTAGRSPLPRNLMERDKTEKGEKSGS